MSATLLGLDAERWERLMDLSGGALQACYQCGTCAAVCPWGQVRPEPFSLRKLVHAAQIGLEQPVSDDVWLCTTCAACQARCPRGVQVEDVIGPLRQLAWDARRVPAGLNSVLWDLHWDGNPWGQPPSHRSDWARGLDIRRFEPTDEALYYVGCTASYDARMRKVARAIAATLQAAGVAFGTLGDDEPCCGDPARSLGQLEYMHVLVERATRQFQDAGVTRLVTTSPHCFDMFHRHYADLESQHYTQYLAGLLAQGRLRLEHPVELTATFHDPCYLGRHNGEYDAPRALLAAIPGLRLIEMDASRAEALCCGGGGGRMWQDTPAGERFADLRARQAEQTGAQVLVTACPHCISCLEDAARSTGLKVMDVAELVRLAVEGSEP
jgi:Fe-S oxidoreductase